MRFRSNAAAFYRVVHAGFRRSCVFALVLGAPLLAQEAPQTMTKIVVRLEATDVPADGFAAKPKTMYRAGMGYCRIEELPDEKNGIHGLMIINEPDTWMVNLFTKTAQHVPDPGPTFNCRMPIFVFGEEVKSGQDMNKPMMGLEFGRELAYFEARKAKATEGPVLQGKSTTAYITKVGDSQLLLFTVGAPEHPWAIVRQHGDAREMYWYTTYEKLPFDSRLFDKPSDVKIEEAKQ